MAEINMARLQKVLALTASDKEGEALAALRQARQMLFAGGLSLADLAQLASAPMQEAAGSAGAAKKPSAKAGARNKMTEAPSNTAPFVKALEKRIAVLERQVQTLRQELAMTERQAERWRQLALRQGADSQRSAAAAAKWQNLARQTAAHLWELGEQLYALEQTDKAASLVPENSDNVIINFARPR